MKRRVPPALLLRRGLVLASAVLLTACGSEGPASLATSANAPAAASAAAAVAEPAVAGVTETAPRDVPATQAEAARFLAKSTFGPTQEEIDRLMKVGYSAWIDEQFEKTSPSHLDDFGKRVAAMPEAGTVISTAWPQNSFWRAMLSGEDALRRRVAYSLSQILVVSMQNSDIGLRMGSAYLDVLTRNAFGNYRTLLEEATLSPAMGVYLSALGNRKEDMTVGRLPDENYAREIMQLFTIGLHELNQDGTVKLDARNEPIETYGMADIAGLSRVFTGFGWAGPDTSSARFVNRGEPHSERDFRPMQGYPQFHETGPKTFLGTTVSATTPEASLKAALDHLFAHPNVGPFIGKQLIQRMVTSNPSPAYVGRVAEAFNNNGQGVRGDLKAVVKAVLLDPEASTPPVDAIGWNGRMREPLLRMTTMLRALGAKSSTGNWTWSGTEDPIVSIGMASMRAPSVFNFYRPGYVPPNTKLATSALVAPELQIFNEVSAAGFLNAVKGVLDNDGAGGGDPRTGKPDIAIDWSPLVALARTPAALVDRTILLMAPGQVPTAVRNQIAAEVASVAIPSGADTDANVLAALRNRARLAVLLLVVTPEFTVQR
jgi:uncharacterized protein (DUF1800 family)